MKVWLNGRVLPADAAHIAPTDRGFTLGDGVFETVCVTEGRIRHLDRHLRRLRTGLTTLGLPLALDDAELVDAITRTVQANALGSAAVRLTVSRGPGARGALPPSVPAPTVLVMAGSLSSSAAPASAITCTVTRRNEMSPLSRIKSVNFLDNVLARQEAAARNADEALLLNTQGRLAEASAANVFVLRGNILLTPPVADGALPGIMREILIECCGAAEAPLSVRDVFAADSSFLSNCLGLRPLLSLDGQPLRTNRDWFAALVRHVMMK